MPHNRRIDFIKNNVVNYMFLKTTPAITFAVQTIEVVYIVDNLFIKLNDKTHLCHIH